MKTSAKEHGRFSIYCKISEEDLAGAENIDAKDAICKRITGEVHAKIAEHLQRRIAIASGERKKEWQSINLAPIANTTINTLSIRGPLHLIEELCRGMKVGVAKALSNKRIFAKES